MQITIYNNFYNTYFLSAGFIEEFKKAMTILQKSKQLFFIGNGGSNAICSHMLEDFAKIAGFRTFSFSDSALITCFSNDYGYNNAMAEWLKIYANEGDTLFAISSSGNSENIINAAKVAKQHNLNLVTLSGFKEDNKLRKLGNANFYLPIENYGVVECFHQVVMHALLDDYSLELKADNI